ncbi:MAG: BrnT family toxin [Pseudohongiellaceae bacterium]
MTDLVFEWNTQKEAVNAAKHGVTFSEAQSAFTDEFARLIPDPEHSEDEDRFILLGMSFRSRLLVVCHCVRSAERIRVISARKATRQERIIYEDFRHA